MTNLDSSINLSKAKLQSFKKLDAKKGRILEKGTTNDYSYTIRHFSREVDEQNHSSKPFLGRMDFSGSFKPVKEFGKILK